MPRAWPRPPRPPRQPTRGQAPLSRRPRPPATAASVANATAPVVVIALSAAGRPGQRQLHPARHARGAREAGAQLIVLEMDTPGGLDLSMREIIQAILASPVPVASYVYVRAARARPAPAPTSSSCQPYRRRWRRAPILAPPARSQIGIGGHAKAGNRSGLGTRAARRRKTSCERKQMHDASAYIRGLAQLRGRNAECGASARSARRSACRRMKP
ncbi:hypothetical protein ACU4GD_25535 [Cupriavidus basilensis]